ncbi:hypothetical protein MASR1M49_40480 [Pararhodobacter aggregans]
MRIFGKVKRAPDRPCLTRLALFVLQISSGVRGWKTPGAAAGIPSGPRPATPTAPGLRIHAQPRSPEEPATAGDKGETLPLSARNRNKTETIPDHPASFLAKGVPI